MKNVSLALVACLLAFLLLREANSRRTPLQSSAEREAVFVETSRPFREQMEFEERWHAISRQYNKGGVYVEPWTEQAPYTMRIHLPREISAHNARKFANGVRVALGEKAIVYIYDDTRKQLAKAASWGTE